jgi:lipoprotein-anchoring transpeptidase ErfK/SrfK
LRAVLRGSSDPPDWLRVLQRLSQVPRSSARPRRRREGRRRWLHWAIIGFAVGTGGAALFTLASAEGQSLPPWASNSWATLGRYLISAKAYASSSSLPAEHGDKAIAPEHAEALPVASQAAGADAAKKVGIAARALTVDATLTLIATARQTYVYAEPSLDSRRLGYLRAGQVVARSREPAGFDGCSEGFYRVEPEGFVCAGQWASLDPEHAAASVLGRGADRAATLPYRYALSRFPTPFFYSKVPSFRERLEQESELDFHVRSEPYTWRLGAHDAVPFTLQNGGAVPGYDGVPVQAGALTTGRAITRSGFALSSLFEVDGYEYGMTTELAVVALDRLDPAEPSDFHGVHFERGKPGRIAFVKSRTALLYAGQPTDAAFAVKRRIEYREAIPLSGNSVDVGPTRFLETTWGDWLIDARLASIGTLESPPSWATRGRPWIDVSIKDQTLVAYEGAEPVFATLVSTASDGLVDPDSGGPSVRGVFMIHTKHVTWDLGANGGDDNYDLRDVPYVQFFHEGLALHGAYWHDNFGVPRNHGCINIAPADARWLFDWTEPRVPERWHGAYGFDGTLVNVHE